MVTACANNTENVYSVLFYRLLKLFEYPIVGWFKTDSENPPTMRIKYLPMLCNLHCDLHSKCVSFVTAQYVDGSAI